MCGTSYVPETFNVLGSNNGADWYIIDTNLTITTADVLNEFILAPTECKYLKLEMISTANTSFYEIKEFEVYAYE